MPTQEEVDEFFLQFAKEMEHAGLFIMDNFKEMWDGLPSIDDIREEEKDAQSSDEEDEYD